MSESGCPSCQVFHTINRIFSDLDSRLTVVRAGLLYHTDSRPLAGFHRGAETLIRETLEAAWDEALKVVKEDISARQAEEPEPKRWSENSNNKEFDHDGLVAERAGMQEAAPK